MNQIRIDKVYRRRELVHPLFNCIPIAELKLKNTSGIDLFLCIWSQKISLERCCIEILYREGKQYQYIGDKLKLIFDTKMSESKKTLLIDKKANFLDDRSVQSKFLGLTKGNYLKIKGNNNYTECVFEAKYDDQKLRFATLLKEFYTEDNNAENIEQYMYRRFGDEIKKKGSFSFAIYLKVKARKEEDCYFFDMQQLPKNIPIFEFIVTEKVAKNKSRTTITVDPSNPWNPKKYDWESEVDPTIETRLKEYESFRGAVLKQREKQLLVNFVKFLIEDGK